MTARSDERPGRPGVSRAARSRWWWAPGPVGWPWALGARLVRRVGRREQPVVSVDQAGRVDRERGALHPAGPSGAGRDVGRQHEPAFRVPAGRRPRDAGVRAAPEHVPFEVAAGGEIRVCRWLGRSASDGAAPGRSAPRRPRWGVGAARRGRASAPGRGSCGRGSRRARHGRPTRSRWGCPRPAGVRRWPTARRGSAGSRTWRAARSAWPGSDDSPSRLSA